MAGGVTLATPVTRFFQRRSARDQYEKVHPEIIKLIDQGEMLAAMNLALRQRQEISRAHGGHAAKEVVDPTIREIFKRGVAARAFAPPGQKKMELVDLALMQPGADIGAVAKAGATIEKTRAQTETERQLRQPRVEAELALGGQRTATALREQAKRKDLLAQFAGRGEERRKRRAETDLLRQELRAGGKGGKLTLDQANRGWRETFKNANDALLALQAPEAGSVTPQQIEDTAAPYLAQLNGIRSAGGADVRNMLPELEIKTSGEGPQQRVILFNKDRQAPSPEQLAQVPQSAGTAAGQMAGTAGGAIQGAVQQAPLAQAARQVAGGDALGAVKQAIQGAVQGGGGTGGMEQAPQLPAAPGQQFQAGFGIPQQQPQQAPPQSVVPEFPQAVAQQIQQAMQAGQPIAKSQVRAALLAQGITDRMQQEQMLQQLPWGQ